MKIYSYISTCNKAIIRETVVAKYKNIFSYISGFDVWLKLLTSSKMETFKFLESNEDSIIKQRYFKVYIKLRSIKYV